MTTNDKLIEAVARAIMVSDGCGYTLDGARAFCDDTRLVEVQQQRSCACKVSASAALAVVLAHYSDPANVSDGMYKAAYGIEYMAGAETRAIFAKQFAAAMKAAG
jgi:hypothetical protein